MRYGRAKAARKTLQHFARVIGLKAPYSIILDATLIAAMFSQQLFPVKERVDRVLQTTGSAGPNRYCITYAAVEELKSVHRGLKKKQHPKEEAFQQAIAWIQQECIILKQKDESESIDDAKSETTRAQKDLLKHIAQDDKPYVVATQDEIVLEHLRRKGTVPIVRLANNSVLLLENPSKQSQWNSRGDERKKWTNSLPDAEKALVDLVQQEKKQKLRTTREQQLQQQRQQSNPKQRTKSKAKGPNPLSCKRKQTPGNSPKESVSQKRRNRSKRQKLSEGL